MINIKYYSTDFVNPLPHIFGDGIAVMTPPKNASTFINVFLGRNQGRLNWVEGEVKTKIAIKRDPIDRWCGAVNQQRGRLKGVSDLEEAFWYQDPNVIVKLHAPEDSPIRDISEFCGQFDWSGPTKDYDAVYYLHQVDDLLKNVLGVTVDKTDPLCKVYRHKSTDKDIELVLTKDLTDESKKIIMEQIYQDDYKHGWF
jgi:hypothetical protein